MTVLDARPAPAVDDAAVVATRDGQLGWLLSSVPRVRHATGQQERCAGCAEAGLLQLGVSREGPGSEPLCLSCWTRRQRRAAAPLTPQELGWLDELAKQLTCDTCGPGPAAAAVDLPQAAVQARRLQRRRGSATRPRSARRRRTDCWRCGAEWVATTRAVHLADQEELAAADAERVGRLELELQAARREAAAAERQLRDRLRWRNRVAEVEAAMPRLTKTGPRGRLELKQAPGAKARAVWQIADFRARMVADRAARGLSTRGRPSQHPLVVGVMAIDADWRSGNRSMAGLDLTALFADVTTRTVTSAWAYSVQVGSTTRVETGRSFCTRAEWEATGLRRRRSVYDFAPLHTSPVDPAPYLADAVAVVAQLLQRAVQLVDEQQAVVARARQAAARAEAAVLDARADIAERVAEDLQLQASVSVLWEPDARAATAAATELRVKAGLALLAPPAGSRPGVEHAADRAAREAVRRAFDLVERMANFFYPPRRGQGVSTCSGYQGLAFFSARSTSRLAGGRRPDGRGEERHGASRSPNRRVAERTSPNRPRTLHGVRSGSRGRMGRPTCPGWAKSLAEGLVEQLGFLGRYVDGPVGTADGDVRLMARQRGLRLRQVADTVRGRFGPQWTPTDVVRLIQRYGVVHSVIAAGEAHSPLAYLRAVLQRALTNPDAVVPWPSPVRAAFERELAAERQADLEAGRALRQAAWQELEEAAAAERAGGGAGRAAARAAARDAAAKSGLDTDRARPAGVAPDAAAADSAASAWPAVTLPGAGVPASWQAGDDRDRRSPTHG